MFCGTFFLACAISLTYVYTRPAEYRAIARLLISPAGGVEEATDATSPALKQDPNSFLTEVQVMTSRPLLQEAVSRLDSAGELPDFGEDPVDAVQRMLRAEPVEGTQVVQLSAEGTQRNFLSRLVNTVADAYRGRVADTYKSRATGTYADVGNEAEALQKRVAEKRSALDAFRQRYDIVSLEREETYE